MISLLIHVNRLPENPCDPGSTPKRCLLPGGAGNLDPASRETGFGIDVAPSVAYFPGCFNALVACATGLVTRGALSTTGFVGLATATRRGPLIVENDLA